MPIILVGMNHRTAPVELREQFSLDGCGLRMALETMQINTPDGLCSEDVQTPSVLREGAILTTCNRLENYAVAADAGLGRFALEDFLVRLQGISREQIYPHLYFFEDQTAIQHLMRVAAGLDSMILGEPQILGQVSDAYREALASGTAGPILSQLFMQAIHAGKRARTETAISRHTTSVSHAAVSLAEQQTGDLSTMHVLLVGSGEMAEQAAQALRQHGAQNITCINRTYARARNLAEHIQSQAVNWSKMPEALAQADVVITATGAPHLVITADDVAAILPERGGRPLLFVDIAVPRDVEETVDSLAGVKRYDIDDLQSVVDDNLAQRQAAVPHVELIIDEEIACFQDWLSTRQVVPVIKDLRRKARELAQAEVEEALRHLNGLDTKDRQVIARMAHRIVNKMLHEPTVRLKASAENGNGSAYAQALWDLFALGEGDVHDA